MAKIKITEEDLDYYKSNKEFLNQALTYSIRARDVTALKLLFESTNLKSCFKLTQGLFGELVTLARDNNNANIVELIINELDVDLSQQKDQKTKATLLDQAAYHGAIDIVTFLLEKGFSPNNQDSQGFSSLHRAVVAEHIPTINELVKKGANLNIRDEDGNTPLHIATIQKSRAIVEALKFLGVQEHLKNNARQDVQALHRLVVKGQGPNALVKPQATQQDEDLEFDKGMADFYKAILSEGDKEKYFASAIDNIKNFLTKSPTTDKNAFVYKVSNRILFTLITIYEQYKFEDSDKLQEYIINTATSWHFDDVLAILYNAICVECLARSDYRNADKYATLAYNKLGITTQSKPHTETQYAILFNLGLAWKHLDIAKSLPYFAQAEGVKPNDQEAIIEQLKHYINLVDIDNASKQIEKIEDSDLKDLYQIRLNIVTTPNFPILTLLKDHTQNLINPALEKLSGKMFEFASEPNSSLSQLLGTFFQNNILKNQQSYLEIYKEIWVKYFLRNKQFNKAIECCNELNICTKEHDIPTRLFKILEIYKEAELWDKGLKSIQDMYEKHSDTLQHHTFPPLKLLEFIFYKQEGLEEQAESCLKFLTDNASAGGRYAMLLSYAKEFAFYVDIEQANFDAASSYLNANPTLLTTDKLTILLAVLQEWLLVQPTGIEATEEKTVQEEKADAVVIDLIDDSDKLTKFITKHLKAVHAFFQQQKQDLLKQRLYIIAKEQQLQKQQIIWCTEKGIYTYNPDNESAAQQYIHPVKNKFYVMIDPKLVEQLDRQQLSQQLSQFKAALLKGFVSKKHGNHGIKIMDNKMAELKTAGDGRLYTDHIYQNSQDECLIIFNKYANHKEVIKALKKHANPLTIVKTDETSYAPTLPKESKCSATSGDTTQDIDFALAMSLAEEEAAVETLGVSDS